MQQFTSVSSLAIVSMSAFALKSNSFASAMCNSNAQFLTAEFYVHLRIQSHIAVTINIYLEYLEGQ